MTGCMLLVRRRASWITLHQYRISAWTTWCCLLCFFSSHIMSIAVLYPRCLLFMGTIHVLFSMTQATPPLPLFICSSCSCANRKLHPHSQLVDFLRVRRNHLRNSQSGSADLKGNALYWSRIPYSSTAELESGDFSATYLL